MQKLCELKLAEADNETFPQCQLAGQISLAHTQAITVGVASPHLQFAKYVSQYWQLHSCIWEDKIFILQSTAIIALDGNHKTPLKAQMYLFKLLCIR